MSNFKFITILFLTILIFSCSDDKGSSVAPEEEKVKYSGPTLFEDLDSSKTHIDFSNKLKEDLSGNDNLFEYDYFYNGAGVAAIDINQDGLQDLFFAGNQVDNRLYLNEGDFNFKDITKEAGIEIPKKAWSNGVTIVDINNDGHQDIYVCQGGAINNKRTHRENLLFVNNGDLTFTEKAVEYGLNDAGISTQALFFDFDRDGDQDCYIMNESFINLLDVEFFFKKMLTDQAMLYSSSNHLYINEKGKFIDKTVQFDLLRPAFSLAGMLNDFNDDGYQDLFIGNDYTLPDVIYLNENGKGLKNNTKEMIKHTSFYTMGVDIADINNDGLKDIFTVDMAFKDHVKSKLLMAGMSTEREKFFTEKLKFSKQYMFNSLHLNQGDMKFSDVAMAYNIDKSEWSWTTLLTDFDYDGNKEIFITNGYPRYGKNNDFQLKFKALRNKYNNLIPLFVKDSLHNSLEIGLSKNQLYSLENDVFVDNADKAGLDYLGVTTGAIYVDLDNDGDLDIVTNNTNTTSKIYRNKVIENGDKKFYKFTVDKSDQSITTVNFHKGSKVYTYDNNRVRGYLGSVDPSILAGFPSDFTFEKITLNHEGTLYDISDIEMNQTHKINSLIRSAKKVKESPSNTLFATNEKIVADIGHTESFYDDFAIEILLPYKQSTWGPAIAKADLNGDGIEDIVLGSSKENRDKVYFASADGSFSASNSVALPETIFGETQDIKIVDINGDGLKDILVASGSNEFFANNAVLANFIYINQGNGKFDSDLNAFVNKTYKNTSSIDAIDYDSDGDMDLLVGNRGIPQKYPYAEGSQLYRNDGGKFTEVTADVVPAFAEMGMVSDILVTDFDGDGKQDFIAVGEWTAPALFKNDGGSFSNVSNEYGIADKKSWWLSVSETDINNDAKPDYVFGSVGKAIKFNPSPEHPLRVNAADFDNNGTNDIVLNKDYKGKRVPIRGRECSSQQMPNIPENFPTYQAFATSSVEEILGKEFYNSLELEVTGFEHFALISDENGAYKMEVLPIEAQYHPIMQTIGLNIDDKQGDELVLLGSLYDTEIETSRLDAVSGTVLTYENNRLVTLPRSNTGLRLDIPVREGVYLEESKSLIVAQNNGPLRAYSLK